MPRVVDFIVDAKRTCLQERFFAHFAFATVQELSRAVAEMQIGLDSIVRSEDASSYVYSGWVYWFLFLKGYQQAETTGSIGDENIYLNYLTQYYAPRGHDPGLALELSDIDRARDRIKRRFDVMDMLRTRGDRDAMDEIEPIIVTVSPRGPDHPLLVYPVDSPHALGGRLVDGWHRLFAARLAGTPALRGRAIFEDQLLEEVS